MPTSFAALTQMTSPGSSMQRSATSRLRLSRWDDFTLSCFVGDDGVRELRGAEPVEHLEVGLRRPDLAVDEQQHHLELRSFEQ